MEEIEVMEKSKIDTASVSTTKPASRIPLATENVWEWISQACYESPIQPIANLGIGFIELNPPDFIIDAHKNSLQSLKVNQYGPTEGIPELTEALSGHYSTIYGRTIDPKQEISIHTGGTEAILSCLAAFVNKDEEVIVLEPAFNLYNVQIFFLGATIRTVPLKPPRNVESEIQSADTWTVDIESIKQAINAKTKMLILNSPHNPLGKVFTREELLAIGELCVANSILIISDEVYEYLCYKPSFTRIGSLTADISRLTLTIGSAGKAFNATGWRVGWVIADKELIHYVKLAHILLSYTTAGPPQMAVATGLIQAGKLNFWDSNRDYMKQKTDELCSTLRDMGLPYTVPSGAYFIFVNTSKISIPSDYLFPVSVAVKPRDWKLAWFLIQEIGLATIPGSAFYDVKSSKLGENFLRLITCKSDEGMELAKARLRKLKPWIRT